jgi:hypothetical protein
MLHLRKSSQGRAPQELREEGSGSAGGTEEEYVHLDTDDLVYLELLTDEEAVESAAEQRVLMSSFETQHRDESDRHLMAVERRAAMDELAASQQSARQAAYLHNLAAEDEARAAAAGRWPQKNRARVAVERRLQEECARPVELARVREYQYPSPPTTPTPTS